MGVNEPSTPKATYEGADREMASERFRVESMVRGYHVYKMCKRCFLKTEILRCKIPVVEAILCSAVRFAISAFCTSVNFAYNSLLDYKVSRCSLCMRLPSAFVAEIEEDGTSLVAAPWGSGSFWSALTGVKQWRRDMFWMHDCQLSHTTAPTGVDPMNIRIISLSRKVSRNAIFAVEKPSAKSAKIVLLENLAPYGIQW